MGYYTTYEQLYNAWKKQCSETVKEVVPPVMKSKMKEAIKMEVYARYEPTLYDRRYDKDGGLLDDVNYKYKIEINDNKIIVVMTNDAKGDDRGKYVNTQPDTYIDSILISGTGYTWEKSRMYSIQPHPRDFYAKTEELLNDGEIRMKIIQSLNKKGIIVK